MAPPTCYCGLPAALKQVTDERKASYGRWFYGCKNFNKNRNPCSFFDWYEGDCPQPGEATGDLQKVGDKYICLLCGLSCVLGDGEHRCRLYGLYQCSCGHTWSSGYTWVGESQQCRVCGAYQGPGSCQQLQRGVGGGTGRPHDSARCGMCQALGRPCYQAARPGEPGFVTAQRYGSYGY